MNLSTQLAFRPRPAAASSVAFNASPVPPPNQPPDTSEAATEDSLNNLRGQIHSKYASPFCTLALFLFPGPSKVTKLLTIVQLELLGALWVPMILTNYNEGFYYTCILDGYGRLAYSSLAQNSAEESLRVVLEMVRGDDEFVKEENEDIERELEDVSGDEEEDYGHGENEGQEEDYEYEDDDYVDDEMDMD